MAMNSRKRAKRRAELETAQRRLDTHSSGGDFTAITLPKGVGLWNPKKEGVYNVCIIPYTVGAGNPYAGEGKLYYERTYFTHRYIGPDKKSYVCMAKSFGKKCAVCEERSKLSSDPDQDKETQKLIKDLAPKQRQLFNVVVQEEKEKGVQIWEISFHNFGEYLDEKIRKSDPDKRDFYRAFFNPDRYYMLRLGATEDSMGSNKFLVFNDIEFKRLKDGLDEEWLEAAVCLDEIPKKIKFDKLVEIISGSEGEDDEDDDEPKKKKKKGKGKEKDDEDDDNEDEEDDEDDEEEDTDDDEEEDEDDTDDDEGDEDDDDEGDDDDEEEDDDEDDDEEEDDDEDDDGDDDDLEDSDDSDESAISKGDKVRFKYKGKKLVGIVKKVKDGKDGEIAYVKCKDRDMPHIVDTEELTVIDDEPDDEDDNDPPFKKKKSKKGK